MLVDLSSEVRDFLYNVFVIKLTWLVLVGYAGQALFVTRFVVQWIATERARKSVIPVAFWVFSISGGLLLFGYALLIRDPVFIFGQGFGILVYLRNLYFVYREKRGQAAKTA